LVPWIHLIVWLHRWMVCLRFSSPTAGYWLYFSIDLNRSLRALVSRILAGRLEFFRHRVYFGMGLVVGPHFKNLGSHVRTNPATNA